MQNPRHTNNQHGNNGRQDNTIDTDKLHKNNIQHQIHKCRHKRAESVFVPDSGCIFVGDQDLVYLADEEIHNHADNNCKRKHPLLCYPEPHERLIQTEHNCTTHTGKPHYNKRELLQIRIVFFFRLHQNTVSDTCSARYEHNIHDSGYRSQHIVIIVVKCIRSKS